MKRFNFITTDNFVLCQPYSITCLTLENLIGLFVDFIFVLTAHLQLRFTYLWILDFSGVLHISSFLMS